MDNQKCEHEEWIKVCVLCGEVIEDTSEPKETGTETSSSNKTIFAKGQGASTLDL